MRNPIRYSLAFLLCIFSASLNSAQAGPRFEVVVPASAHSSAITGRVYVVISSVKKSSLLGDFGSWRQQVPFFGQDVASVTAGTAMVVGEDSPGYPLKSLKDLPAGDYYAQALVKIYTEFHRADGHTVQVHLHQWEGLDQTPPNLYSDVQFVHLDPAQRNTIRLQASHIAPPLVIPSDTEWVKHIRIESRLLTRFWGRPTYIGATILLPAGYAEHSQQYYPVIYEQTHFSLEPPLSVRMTPPTSDSDDDREAYQTFQAWSGPHFARMIAVTFQHPTPFYDDSYAVNSANNGPYGDALIKELIPYIESHFRIVREPWARVLTGGSTGGWESLALQLYHPAFFGGTFTGYPDPIDFRHYQLIDIYTDKNAFLAPSSQLVKHERPFRRNPDGQVVETEREMSQLESALGSHGRSSQQLDAWDSVFDPAGSDGYPQRLWDMQTGEIDPAVVNYIREHGYDLRAYLEKNWSSIGPQLTGKIFMWTGDMDGYYLNLGVYGLDDFLQKHPEAHAHFEYGRPMQGHGWTPWTETELIRMMARHVAASAPAGKDVSGWYEP